MCYLSLGISFLRINLIAMFTCISKLIMSFWIIVLIEKTPLVELLYMATVMRLYFKTQTKSIGCSYVNNLSWILVASEFYVKHYCSRE